MQQEQKPEQQQLQTQQQQQVQPHKYPNIPHFSWPTSKPGPRTTLPPPGQKPMPGRTEQLLEVGHNQETGTAVDDSPLRSLPGASLPGHTPFRQQETAQPPLKKGRK